MSFIQRKHSAPERRGSKLEPQEKVQRVMSDTAEVNWSDTQRRASRPNVEQVTRSYSSIVNSPDIKRNSRLAKFRKNRSGIVGQPDKNSAEKQDFRSKSASEVRSRRFSSKEILNGSIKFSEFDAQERERELDSANEVEIISLRNTLCNILFQNDYFVTQLFFKFCKGTQLKMFILSIIDVAIEESIILPFVEALIKAEYDTEDILTLDRPTVQPTAEGSNTYELLENVNDFETWIFVSSFVRQTGKALTSKIQPQTEKLIAEANAKLNAKLPESITPRGLTSTVDTTTSALQPTGLFYEIFTSHFQDKPQPAIIEILLKTATKIVKHIVLTSHQSSHLAEASQIGQFYALYAEERNIPLNHVNSFYFCCFFYPLFCVKITTKKTKLYFLLILLLRDICSGNSARIFSQCSLSDTVQIHKIEKLFARFKTSINTCMDAETSLGDQIISLCRINDRAFLNVTKLFTEKFELVWKELLKSPQENNSTLLHFLPFASVGIKNGIE